VTGLDPARDSFLALSLVDQCRILQIPLERISLNRVGSEWSLGGVNYRKPEAASLAFFEQQGHIGTCCEGAAPLMIMKCASLDYLSDVNTFGSRDDACMRLFEAQCFIHAENANRIVDAIAGSTERTVRANFREIVSQPHYLSVYPVMDEDALAAIWRAATPVGLANLARALLSDPYKYRAGWPDLTLARADELRFVEIKTKDRLHSSQRTVIGAILKPWGASVSVMQVMPKTNV
jgi:hypothetical protein